jgi:hypothetical protein
MARGRGHLPLNNKTFMLLDVLDHLRRSKPARKLRESPFLTSAEVFQLNAETSGESLDHWYHRYCCRLFRNALVERTQVARSHETEPAWQPKTVAGNPRGSGRWYRLELPGPTFSWAKDAITKISTTPAGAKRHALLESIVRASGNGENCCATTRMGPRSLNVWTAQLAVRRLISSRALGGAGLMLRSRQLQSP